MDPLRDRLDELCQAADRLRLPSHRYTAEQAMVAHDEIRSGLRRLRRDLDLHVPAITMTRGVPRSSRT